MTGFFLEMSNSSGTAAAAAAAAGLDVEVTMDMVGEQQTAANDLVLVESKDFAQVVFDDVRDEYAENGTVECEFTLNELLAADETDWIGVYKVGFSSHRDFVCKAPVELALIANNHGKVCFSCKFFFHFP